MLSKRIIACLDVKDGVVVKGVQFRNHVVMGDVLELAQRYRDEGVDELVFYDITASSDHRVAGTSWIKKIAQILDVPFCVAGGIRTWQAAERILNEGADKISINSPALERPEFITELADRFGTQCVVVGVDSRLAQSNQAGSISDRQSETQKSSETQQSDIMSAPHRLASDNQWVVYQYSGDERKTIRAQYQTLDWLKIVQDHGAGEIVLNCMGSDGVRRGYDIPQLMAARECLHIPLIASGGAGELSHFADVFRDARVDGALAASVFHNRHIHIATLKNYLHTQGIEVRR